MNQYFISSKQEPEMSTPEFFSLYEVVGFAGEVLWKVSLAWSVPFFCLFLSFLLALSRLKKCPPQK